MNLRQKVSSFILSHQWQIGLSIALTVGAVFRLIWGMDIEYKGDEAYNFIHAMNAGRTEPFPVLGMVSGVGTPNPGMSIWVFVALARLFQVTNPVELARVVQLLNLLALGLLTIFALRMVPKKDREIWLWGIAFACVNQLDLALQRKIWGPSVFPIFVTAMLMCWWRRERFLAAFFWGLIGACLGQLQMTAFAYALAFFLFTFIFQRRNTDWLGWLLGSAIGTIPLWSWLVYQSGHLTELAGTHSHRALEFSMRHHPLTWLVDASHIQYFGVWIVNSLGVGYDYNLHQGAYDFLYYPYVFGQPTLLVLIASIASVGIFVAILAFAIKRLFQERDYRAKWNSILLNKTYFGLLIALLGYGVLNSMARYFFQRHHLMVTFPYEFVFLSALTFFAFSQRSLALSRMALLAMWLCQLIISANFLLYIHTNGGAPQGDYGTAFGAQHESPAPSE